MKFTEDSRVKIPSIIHLTRLGYKYLPLKNAVYDENTNIFSHIFKESILSINKDSSEHDVDRKLEEVKLVLDNEDLVIPPILAGV